MTGVQVQEYISRRRGWTCARSFAQYLTTTKIPVLEYRLDGTTLSYRWADVVPGFAMPVRVSFDGTAWTTLRPTTEWQTQPARTGAELKVDPNYYVVTRRL